MPSSSSSKQHPILTIFSSIPDIATSLRKAAPTLPLQVIEDPALSGSGGKFDPSQLTESTVQSLQQAQALVTEPAVLAALLQHNNAFSLSSLKWFQSTFAGVDPLFQAGLSLPLPFQVTRMAGTLLGPPIAEGCLARIIGHERKFDWSREDQQNQQWAARRPQLATYRCMRDLTLTILGGAGDIGRCIGKVAQAFGMKVIGYGKTNREGQAIPGLDEYTTDLNRALEKADYIVSVLPSTPETRGMLSGDALKAANGAVFLNVGRGDIIAEESLIYALDQNYISAAILDVFATEPLPQSSPLWKRSDVVVSPHVSGVTRAQDVPDLVLENYHRYVEGKELLYQVDWGKGY